MLTISRKGKIYEAQKWDELFDYELIEIFRRIHAQWYDVSGRLELSTWLYTEQCSNKFVVNKIRLAKTNFYGPGDGFRNMSGGEFLFAETYYFTYLKDKDPEHLNKFIASIFREKKPILNRLAISIGLAKVTFKDIRKEFDETLISARAKLIEKLPQETKQAIVYNYGAVRKDMTNALPYLFPKKGHPEPVEGRPDKKEIIIPNWETWFWKLANGNTDEAFDAVANSRVRNILRKIDSLIKESKTRK